MSDFPKMASSRIISKFLSPALGFWLRSQVEKVDSLHFEIQGEDRQILSGYIPIVYLLSEAAIYRGLNLGKIEVLSQNIRINIGQILRGKPLRLLEPIQVTGKVQIRQDDLQTSLDSPIFSNALNDLLLLLLESSGIENFKDVFNEAELVWQKIILEDQKFQLEGKWMRKNHQETHLLALSSLMQLTSPNILRLSSVEFEGPYQIDLTELTIDLGENVELSSLVLSHEELIAQGKAIIQN